MEERLSNQSGLSIDQNFYTVENTRDDSITDDSYFTQWEREEPDQFNVEDKEQTPIGSIHQKHKNEE